MTHRRIAVLVGFLFLSSSLTFAVGSSLVAEYFSSGRKGFAGLLAGVLLEGYTGLAVAAIGILLLSVLRPHGKRAPLAYLVLRATECSIIIAVGIYFLASRQDFHDYALLVYAFAGAGGVTLSYVLLRSRLVAVWLSVLGLAGYSVLLLGVLADVLGIADLDSGVGIVFYVPGGVFEIVFPLVLLLKGFRPVKNASQETCTPAVPQASTR
ncbi:DUF4386 domain-containing protein [Streptomyces sp. NBC_00237]|uniref:DUF4386 domain-containing protein n=1 Tax=Streptomyces sp. NBC_00237 TaxID=2975687 RepID=UPI0022589884|nr:DUF4386 domain-containing protein [Streptomyces sp. NBC_00237]MCX5205826.1 DUF4386 domain-containing protein [Streptomyces sp. NBC_00237]